MIGNHDWTSSGDRMWRALDAAGVTVLEDRAVNLGRFWVAGLGDMRHRAPDVRAALQQIPLGAPAIVLSHDPDMFPEVPPWLALTLAGHTHGGQVAIPFIGPPITMSNVSREVAAGGLHEIDGIPIYLSNGVGLERATAPQVRFNSRPSVGIVTLT